MKIKFSKNICIISIILCVISITINILLIMNKEEKIYMDENIVFFGDSITNRYKLDEYFSDHYVVNSGIGGDKTEDLLERLEKDVYKYNPSKVFLLIGINDLNHSIDEETVLKNIQKIITNIKLNREHTEIYVQSIYPLSHKEFDEHDYNFNRDVTNKRIKKINQKIEEICIENDITYINVYDELLDEDGDLKSSYTVEGIHLSDLGYFKVTKVLENYIEK